MAKYVLLDNSAHKNTCVITDYAAKYGSAVSLVNVVPSEFRLAAANYPIVLAKDESTGEFSPCALLGFEQGENLFLSDSGWDATYVPLHIQRQPFRVGFQQKSDSTENDMVISIDVESKRVQEAAGEPLFREHGGLTDYLQRINSILAELVSGTEAAKAFVEVLVRQELIEAVNIDVEFQNGRKGSVKGLYTIIEEKLQTLDGDRLTELHTAGFLQLAHVMIASLAQINRLIEFKNRKLDAESRGTAS